MSLPRPHHELRGELLPRFLLFPLRSVALVRRTRPPVTGRSSAPLRAQPHASAAPRACAHARGPCCPGPRPAPPSLRVVLLCRCKLPLLLAAAVLLRLLLLMYCCPLLLLLLLRAGCRSLCCSLSGCAAPLPPAAAVAGHGNGRGRVCSVALCVC